MGTMTNMTALVGIDAAVKMVVMSSAVWVLAILLFFALLVALIWLLTRVAFSPTQGQSQMGWGLKSALVGGVFAMLALGGGVAWQMVSRNSNAVLPVPTESMDVASAVNGSPTLPASIQGLIPVTGRENNTPAQQIHSALPSLTPAPIIPLAADDSLPIPTPEMNALPDQPLPIPTPEVSALPNQPLPILPTPGEIAVAPNTAAPLQPDSAPISAAAPTEVLPNFFEPTATIPATSIPVPTATSQLAAMATATALVLPTAAPTTDPTSLGITASSQQIDPAVLQEAREKNRDIPHGTELNPATVTGNGPLMIIPKIGIVRPVTAAAINNDQWDVGTLGANIGWLPTTGSKPNDRFAMAFAGHITLSGTEAGPFIDLSLLEVGDEIVYRVEGVDYHYRVERREQVGLSDVEQLYVPDGKMILLITCDSWDDASMKFTTRQTIFARLVENQ